MVPNVTVADTVRQLVVRQMAHRPSLNVTLDDVQEDTCLMEDLGADSLDVVELTMAVEEAFGIDVPDHACLAVVTVRDLIAHAEGRGRSTSPDFYLGGA